MPGPDGEQTYLWDDYYTMSRDTCIFLPRQRGNKIANWCYRIKVDLDSFNENRNPGTPIQISLNFEPDVADMAALDKAKLDAIKAVAS